MRGASFGVGFTACAGDKEAESRFLVVDPSASNFMYTAEDIVRKPRSDAIMRVHTPSSTWTLRAR